VTLSEARILYDTHLTDTVSIRIDRTHTYLYISEHRFMDIPLHIQLRLLAKCSHPEYYTPVGALETERYCLYCSISRFRVGESPLDKVNQHLIIFHSAERIARCNYCNTPVQIIRPVNYCVLCLLTLPEYLSLLTSDQLVALHEEIHTGSIEIRIEHTRGPADFVSELEASSDSE